MKSAALIFVIIAGALRAELPPGATDLVPRSDTPAAESLKAKDETVVVAGPKITITALEPTSSIDVPSIYISKDSKSERKKEEGQPLKTTTMADAPAALPLANKQ